MLRISKLFTSRQSLCGCLLFIVYKAETCKFSCDTIAQLDDMVEETTNALLLY